MRIIICEDETVYARALTNSFSISLGLHPNPSVYTE